MRLGLALLAALLLAPLAQGQLALVPATLSLFAEDPGGSGLLPGAVTPINIVITYTPNNGARPTPEPTPERPEKTAPTRITLAMGSTPSWVSSVTLDPEVVLVDMNVFNGTSNSYTVRAVAHVSVPPGAPAQQREPFIVSATAQPNGNIAGASAESPDSLRLYARVVGLVNVTGPTDAVLPGGRWSTVDFAVRNDGNALTVFKLNVTVRPENSQVEFPETLQLNASEVATVPVRVRTPWTNAEFGTLELEAVPIVDGEEAIPSRAEVAVVGESAVPTPSPAWLLVLLFAAAAKGRARERRDI